MADNYYIPLDEISLEEYEKTIESKELLPGRIILKDDLHENFNKIGSQEIKNLAELLNQLKTKKKIQEFSKETRIKDAYLTVLRREINSYIPKPVKISSFPGIKTEHIESLASIGIKNSKNMFDLVKTNNDLEELVKRANVPFIKLKEISYLSDLVRISGVGPVFARMILDTGTNYAADMAEKNSKQLFKELVNVNNEKNYTKAKFTQKDVQYCIDFAKKLPKGFESEN